MHLYYPEDEPVAAQGCGAGARMASKYPPRPPSPEYSQVGTDHTSPLYESLVIHWTTANRILYFFEENNDLKRIYLNGLQYYRLGYF